VLAIADRVGYEVVELEGGNELSGGVRATVAGRPVEAIVLRPRGGPANPLEDEELHAKFRRNAALTLGEGGAERLLAELDSLQDRPVAEVAAALALGTIRA
jgi:2-methylcitrate dehydratase PrpD